MKNETCCFTGHRKILMRDKDCLEKKLENEMVRLIEEEGVTYFGAGGALGFDTIAAHMVMKLKGRYPMIKLILVLPCEDQCRGWSSTDVEIYEEIKAAADKVVYTSRSYHSGCMYKRNRHLVDNSSYCICYLNAQRGGTSYTVKYAEENGLKIVNIAEK